MQLNLHLSKFDFENALLEKSIKLNGAQSVLLDTKDVACWFDGCAFPANQLPVQQRTINHVQLSLALCSDTSATLSDC